MTGRNGDGASSAKGSRHIIVVDDSRLTLYMWSKLSIAYPIKVFTSPEEFWRASERGETLLGDAVAIITDYYFEEPSDQTGLGFAQELRSRGYDGPLYLSSDGIFAAADLIPSAVEVVPKNPTEVWKQIASRIK